MEFADQGWHHVAGVQVEVVAGAVEVGGHERNGVHAVLAVVGLAELDAGDLGQGVELVGGLQGASQKVFLLDGLRAQLGIDAGAAQEQELLHARVERSVDDVVLDHQVGPDEVHGVSAVGQDSAHLGGGHEHVLGLLFQKELQDRALVLQVGLLAGAHNDVGEPSGHKASRNGASHQAIVSGDKNSTVLVHQTASLSRCPLA